METKLNFEKFLIDNQVLTLESLKALQGQAQAKKLSLFQMLVQSGTMTEDSLAQVLARYYKVDYQPGPLVLDSTLIGQFPAFTLRRYRIIPLKRTADSLTVAMSNPGNFLATDEMQRTAKVPVMVVCCADGVISEALASLGENKTENKKETAAAPPEPGGVKPVLAEVMATIDLVNRVLKRSILRTASDVHFEPQAHFGLIRERIDGILYEVERLSPETFAPVISRVKLLSGMDIVEKRVSQDGRFKFAHEKGFCEIRSSTLPTIYGEKLTLRLLRSDVVQPNLELLDIGEKQLELIKNICGFTDGLVLVAGPTGSGKSTTIYAMLNALDRRKNNLITVEDPVEFELEFANQVQVNHKIGVSFASVLPSILRQDPDYLMVGEVRDEATAQMCMRAAITGHLVFSTIHAPTALQTVSRLFDMGVEAHMIVASLKACISQRLLRRLCPHCKETYTATDADKKTLGIQGSGPITLYKQKGCEKCYQLGYKGRFVAMEILCVDEPMRYAILERDAKKIAGCAEKTGFKAIRNRAAERVAKGDTTIEEMLANCPESV